MANNLNSNVVEDLARIFLDKFESSRVVTKTVNTQLLTPRLTPSTGGEVSFKRPHDYNSIRTSGGDISGSNKSDIISGKATGVVQDYFTVATEWENLEEALELEQREEILAPMAARMVTDLEVDLGKYMLENGNLHFGTPGTAVTKNSDVSGANALMQSIGVPMDGKTFYTMNPFTTSALADAQGALSSGSTTLVDTAWQKAQISGQFGGMQAITSNALKSVTYGTLSDRAGTLSATPTATYVAHKDTMIQSLAVENFAAGTDTIKAGEIITVTGRNRLNLSTREIILDGAAQIIWSGVVTADVSLVGGAGTLLVAGPAIQETDGQYNTVDTALASGDVITILGTAGLVVQPNLFYHQMAFGLGTVKLPKLFSTDTVMTTKDGMSIRVSKYADGDSNTQKIRFDLLPAFITFNPFFAGQGFGKP